METPDCYYAAAAAASQEKQNGKAGAAGEGGDHFIVEDLFDFPNDEEDDDAAGSDGAAGNGGVNSTESSSATIVDSNSNSAGRELGFPADPALSGDLCEPYDELAELEWLSNFVEESFSSEDLEKLHLITGMKAISGSSSAAASRPPPQGPVPGKARSKRSRAAPCSWSSRLLALSPPPISSDSSSESDIFIPVPNPPRKTQMPVAMRKKDPSAGPIMAPSDGRRCVHCQTDKTPQWRTGPKGPKTLCNACGVRFKSGRLMEEYRPAASPTFVLSKHSNSHRKVLELRRQKQGTPLHHYQHQQQYIHHHGVYDNASQSSGGDDYLIHHHIGPDYRQLI